MIGEYISIHNGLVRRTTDSGFIGGRLRLRDAFQSPRCLSVMVDRSSALAIWWKWGSHLPPGYFLGSILTFFFKSGNKNY